MLRPSVRRFALHDMHCLLRSLRRGFPFEHLTQVISWWGPQFWLGATNGAGFSRLDRYPTDCL